MEQRTGASYHYTTDINAEVPIKLQATGYGAQKPVTLCEQFYQCVVANRNHKALFQQKNGVELTWTWGEYFEAAMNFGKAVRTVGVEERATITMMGFNSPQWF
jgi:long-subunit acyl-CoA synthetase (AMP-forming)